MNEPLLSSKQDDSNKNISPNRIFRKIGRFLLICVSIVLIGLFLFGVFRLIKTQLHFQSQLSQINEHISVLQQDVESAQTDLSHLQQTVLQNSQILNDLKQQVSSHAMPKNAVEFYNHLNELDHLVDQLVFSPMNSVSNNQPTNSVQPLNAWQRFLHVLSQIWHHLIIVKSVDANAALFVSPAGQALLKQNCHAELTVAELALLQNQTIIYQSTLQKILMIIQQYADREAPLTQQMIQELTALQASTIQWNVTQDQKT